MSEHDDDRKPDPRLEELADLIDRVAAEEKSVAQEAEGLTEAPGMERVGEFLEASWTAEKPRRSWVPRRLVATAAGVAALFALWFVFPSDPGFDDSGPGPGNVHLSEGDFAFRVPEDGKTVPEWTAIEWDGPGSTEYTLTVLDAATGDVLLTVPRIMEHRIELDPELTSTWPTEIYIDLEMREKDGTTQSKSLTSRRLP